MTAALTAHGVAEQVRVGRVVTEWTELVGSKVARFSLPTDVIEKHGKRTLWVDVASSSWLNELSLLRARLLKRLNDVLGAGGAPMFDDIRFRLARHRIDPGARRTTPVQPAPAAQSSPATGDARARIAREVSAVEDAELREIIARVRIAHDR